MSRHIAAYEDRVRPEWIDSNGHMNLACYVVAFDYATDRLYDVLGIGTGYRAASNNSCFTVETHTLYERELLLGEPLRVHTWVLGVDDKRLHYFHEMVHGETGERVAAQELLALHIDMAVRRVTPFPAERLQALQAAVRDHAPAELPRGAGRRISMPGER